MAGKRDIMRQLQTALLAFILALAFAQSVQSYESDGTHLPLPQFGFNLGGFVTNLESSFRVGSDALGIGLDINLEKVLDLDTSLFVFRTDGFYRFGETRSHMFGLEFFDLRRRASKTLSTDLRFEDLVLTVGTRVDSYFNLRTIKGKYSYSFFQSEHIDVAGSLGLYTMPIEVGVAAQGLEAKSASITAPLPVLGFQFEVALIENLHLLQSAEVLYIELEGFKGRILDLNMGMEYNFWKNLGVGLAFNSFNISLEIGSGNSVWDFVGNIETGYSGLMMYVKFYYF